MNPAGLGACGKLLVATTFLISTATPTLAWYTMDDPTGQTALALCDRSFAPGNIDVPLTRNSRARALDDACKEGASLAHDQWKNPDGDTDAPVVVPDDVKDFRLGYRHGLGQCLVKYNFTNQLQEQMACMDGFDAFAATVVSNVPSYPSAEPPDKIFDDQYYKGTDYIGVYQEGIDDAHEWAYLLKDRVNNPEKYPGYRRDMLFAPAIPDEAKKDAEKMQQQYMAQMQNPQTQTGSNGQGGTVNNVTVVHPNNNFWFWYWYFNHYHSSSYASTAYVPSTSYHQDGGPRSTAAYAGSGYSGGGTTGGGPRPSVNTYGPKAPAVALSTQSPWSAQKFSTSTTAQARFGTPNGAITRGGLGAYGGNATTAEGAPRAGIATASRFRAMSAARVGATVGESARGTSTTGYGAMTGRASSVTSSGRSSFGFSSGGGGRSGGFSGGGGGRGGGGSSGG